MSYYTILEISPGASLAEITRAYRKLAMKWHPDRNNGSKYAEDKFKEIKKAYDVLSDPSHKYEPPVQPKPPVPVQRAHIVDVVPDATVWITLSDVERGILRKASKKTLCPSCNGSGQLNGGVRTIGGTVWGQKQVYASEEDHKLNRCPSCKGTGEVVDFDCYFDIPPGVYDGAVIKLSCLDRNKNQVHRNRTKNIKVRVEAHMFYSVTGNDLNTTHSLRNEEMIEGCEFKIRNIHGGMMTVICPPNVSKGMRLKLTGKGLPDLQSREFGNLYIKLT
jgi:DnaJ-class molecular chaperone